MVICFDTETAPIRPGLQAPPISCLAFCTGGGSPVLISDLERIEALVSNWLDGQDTLAGHNISFDLLVLCAEWPHLLPKVFDAYRADRITDTMLRQKQLDIAGGCYRGRFGSHGKWIKYDYGLDGVARRVAGFPIKKEGFRLFYAPFRGLPVETWEDRAKEIQTWGQAWLAGGARHPELEAIFACIRDEDQFTKLVQGMVSADPREVVEYPKADAEATRAVYEAQETHASYLPDQFRAARKAWWLRLMSAWGMRTNARGVAALQIETQRALDKVQAGLVSAGLVRPDGSRDTKAAKARMLEVCGWAWDEGAGAFVQTRDDARPMRLTDSGQPSLDADACKATDDETLKAYAELSTLKSVLSKDVPALARATVYPVHSHFDMAETGRVTSSKPNVMNWRRLPGIRECFVPRPGHVFAQADYSGLELCTLAQACIDLLGGSYLAEALNEGRDPHTDLACLILGIEYAEGAKLRAAKDHEFDNARQTAKVANFGFPGGLGAAKLCLFARKTYSVHLEEEQARDLKRVWLSKWPEMREYFRHVESLQNEEGFICLTQLRSDRIRGGATYTAACNSYFQGLGADATGAAGWEVTRACYLDESSPLYGCRLVNYVHDEFIVEAPEARAPEAAEELSRLMVQGAQPWIPDVRLEAEPCLMRVWSKDAKTIRDEKGRLIPWSPPTLSAA